VDWKNPIISKKDKKIELLDPKKIDLKVFKKIILSMFFSEDQIRINKLEKLIDLKELCIPMFFEVVPQID